jgi:hypothetical protein
LIDTKICLVLCAGSLPASGADWNLPIVAVGLLFAVVSFIAFGSAFGIWLRRWQSRRISLYTALVCYWVFALILWSEVSLSAVTLYCLGLVWTILLGVMLVLRHRR